MVENRLTAVEQRLDNMDLRLGQFAFNIDFQELKNHTLTFNSKILKCSEDVHSAFE